MLYLNSCNFRITARTTFVALFMLSACGQQQDQTSSDTNIEQVETAPAAVSEKTELAPQIIHTHFVGGTPEERCHRRSLSDEALLRL